MNEQQLEEVLKQSGYPVAENCFEREQCLPYIAYLKRGTANMFADNKVYMGINLWQIELYTKKQDRSAERELEKVLNNAGICWNKIKSYNKAEGYNQIIYETQAIEME